MLRDKLEFVAVLQAELSTMQPYAVVKLAQSIMRYAATLQRLAEHDCNVGLDDRGYRKVWSIHGKIREMLNGTGIRPHFQGDPRGAVVKLILPSGRYNSFGGPEEGYCVP